MADGRGRVHTDRLRAESFGAVAVDYDRYRPGYPEALLDELTAGRSATALDIGCGTGKAARALRERGVSVLGVEIDARMARVARSHGIPVEVAAFETWADRGRRFDLLVCGQAWHWIDPTVGPAKAAKLINQGGRLTLAWNYPTFAEPVQRRLDAVYAAFAPEIDESAIVRGGGPVALPQHARRLREAGFDVEHRRYPWQHTYPTEEWIGLVRTHSDHSTLPEARLAALCQALAAAIRELGGTVVANFVTEAFQCRART